MLAHQIEKEGFVIRLYLEEEFGSPDWDMEEGEKEELNDKIENGELIWFRAHVVALKHGHELGHDYLGGCCYKSGKDFVDNSGYWDDMVDSAIIDARKTLVMLTRD